MLPSMSSFFSDGSKPKASETRSLVLFGGGGFYAGGPRVGGSLGGLILIVIVVMALTGRL